MSQLRFVLLLLAVACTLIRPACAQDSPPPLEDEFQQLQFEDPDTFIKLANVARFEKALKVASAGDVSHDQPTFIRVIICQYRLGRYEDVVKTARQWLRANKSATPISTGFVYELIGTCHLNAAKYKEAVSALEQSKLAYPLQKVDSLLDEARLCLERANKKISDEEFKKRFLSKEEPRVHNVASAIELVFSNAGYVPIVEFEPVSTFPGTGDRTAWKNALDIAMKAKNSDDTGNFAEAAKLYQQAVDVYSLEPSIWSAYANSAMTAELEERSTGFESDKVENAFQQALKLADKDWRRWSNYAAYKTMKTQTPEAKKALEDTLKQEGVPKHWQDGIRRSMRLFKTMDMLKDHYKGNTNKLPKVKGTSEKPGGIEDGDKKSP